MTGDEQRSTHTDSTERTHDQPAQQQNEPRASTSHTVDLTNDDDEEDEAPASKSRAPPPGPFRPPPPAPGPIRPKVETNGSVFIKARVTHYAAPPSTFVPPRRTVAGETSPTMSNSKATLIQPTDPSMKRLAQKPAVQNLGVNPSRAANPGRLFHTAVNNVSSMPKPKRQPPGQPPAPPLAERLHNRAPTASTSRAQDDAAAEERRQVKEHADERRQVKEHADERRQEKELADPEAEEKQRRAWEDEGRSGLLAIQLQREEDLKNKRPSRSSVGAVSVSVKGAAASKVKKKAKGKERAVPPPPATDDDRDDFGEKPRKTLVRGRKEKKPIEVIELDSTDDEDEIEDADAPAWRPPTPPIARNDKGKGKATSHHFQREDDEAHASSEDPMAIVPVPPFNLTNVAGASGSAASGLVKSRVNDIEKKSNVVGALKGRQSTQPPLARKRLANNDDEDAFAPPTKGSNKAVKKTRTGPAPNYDVTSVLAPVPSKGPTIALPITSFFLDDHNFPNLAKFPASNTYSLSYYPSPGLKYELDSLFVEALAKEGTRTSRIIELKAEHLVSIDWPANFCKGQDPILVFELDVHGDGPGKQVYEDLRKHVSKPIDSPIRKTEPNTLTVRIKPDQDIKDSPCSEDLTIRMNNLHDKIMSRWRGVVRVGSISGSGGPSRVATFDERLENHYATAPPIKVASTSNAPNVQAQIAFLPSFKKSNSEKTAELAPRRSKRETNSALRTVPDVNDLTPIYPVDNTPSDKVVLIWPHEGVGAVSVTHGDKQRLRPEEFLNDTLIELGLKCAFDHLFATKPEVADKVHMFNSFFYKKLTTRKSAKEDSSWTAYSTVRKWTQKFDLFKKKYVVVPINENLHWYLAIIVNPGAILVPPAKRVTRASTGGAAVEPEVVIDDEADGDVDQAVLTQKFQDAVNLKEGHEESSDMVVDEEGNLAPAPDANATAGPTREGSPELFGVRPEKEDSDMDMIESDDEAETAAESLSVVPDSQVDPPPPPPTPPPPPAAPAPVARLPTKPTPFGPSQEPPKSKAAPVEPEPVPSASSVAADAPLAQQLSVPSPDDTKCYIITFDSLGSKQGQAKKKLRDYLRDEALDKNKDLKLTDLSLEDNVVMIPAEVPQQDNFCDCGLYLLHFVEHFLNYPDVMLPAIINQAKPPKKTDITATEAYTENLHAIWNEPAAKGKRVTMRDAVNDMCTAWAAFREPLEKQEEQDRAEKRKKKTEKLAAELLEKEKNDAIVQRAAEEERKIEAEKRAEAKKLELAQLSEHAKKVASLENGREVPVQLGKPPKHPRAPLSKVAEDMLARAAPAVAAKAPKGENEDTLDLTKDDEDDSPPKVKPVAAPEASTSTSGKILPPPNPNPPRDAPRSTRASRQASPVAGPASSRQTTPVADNLSETLVLSPDNKSPSNGRRKRDDASTGSLPKAKKHKSQPYVEVPSATGTATNGSAPPSPATKRATNGVVAPSQHTSLARPNHTRFDRNSSDFSEAPGFLNAAPSGGSSKENRDGTPAKLSASLDLSSVGAPAQNAANGEDDDVIIEDAPSSKVATTRAAKPGPVVPRPGSNGYDWATTRGD